MATLRLMKGNYYARIYMKPGIHPTERKIPLRTSDKRIAVQRLNQVREVEEFIKSGEDWKFEWMMTYCRTTPKYLTVQNASDIFIEARRHDNLRITTLQNYKYSLDTFIDEFGSNMSVKEIITETIDAFKKRIRSRLSETSVNIHLRNIRCFLNWLYDRDHIDKKPKFKLIRCDDYLPIYLSDMEFELICKCVNDPFLAEVFDFYRSTGCRLTEPFYAKLEGSFLTISAENAKGRRQRDMELSTPHINTFLQMRERFHTNTESGSYRLGWKRVNQTHEIPYLSREFLKASRAAEISGKKFHCLRHTFAVRRYLITRDIYEVSRLLGHRSVAVTERYTKFDLKKLSQDFPSLRNINPRQEDQIYAASY